METAVVLPVVFFLILMVLQTAWLLTSAMVVQYAAYVGARSAVVHVEDGEFEKMGARSARAVLSAWSVPRGLVSRITVTLVDQRLSVEVAYPFPWLVGASWWPVRFIHGRCALVPEIRH